MFLKKKPIRYQANWLLECLILRIKSPKAYDHLRQGLLALPHPDTLRRLIRGIPGKFGLNQFSIDSIGKNLQGKPRFLRRGSLVWDEMTVKKAVKFARQKMKFDGFQDYGEDVVAEKSEKLADHALVLMFRPYRAKWVQPIDVYATSGAASSSMLQKLVIRAITALHTVDAIVSNVTCDGHQTNKGVHGLFGISGKLDKLKSWIEHPCDPTEKIHFMFDVPHIFKCIRNYMMSHKHFQVSFPFLLYRYKLMKFFYDYSSVEKKYLTTSLNY